MIKSKPLVTVIVTSYNHENYVEHCINSVFSQSYKNIELIVIDDGSIDSSKKTLQKLSRIRSFKLIFHKINKGLASSLNEAISISSGEYISLLASDDYYLDDRISNAVNAFERLPDNYVAVYCDGFVVDEREMFISKFGKVFPRPLFGNSYDNLVYVNWIPSMGITFKASIFNRYKYNSKFLIEDWSFYLKLFENLDNKILFYKKYDFCYRRHNLNHSNNLKAMNKDMIKIKKSFPALRSFYYFYDNLKARKIKFIRELSFKNIKILLLIILRKIQFLIDRENI